MFCLRLSTLSLLSPPYFKIHCIRVVVRIIYFIAFLILLDSGVNSFGETQVLSSPDIGEISFHSSHKNLLADFYKLNDAIETEEEDQEIDELVFFESISLEEQQFLCCSLILFPSRNTFHKFFFLSWMEEKENLPPPYSV